MSAFICSSLHIKTIAVYATEKNIDSYGGYALRNVDGNGRDLSDATTVTQILMEENIKSVCYRYREEIKNYNAYMEQTKVTNKEAALIGMRAFSPVEVLKLIHCLDYQSCEHPDWRESLAYRILRAFERSLLRRLPGYDAAPWSIDDDYTYTPQAES